MKPVAIIHVTIIENNPITGVKYGTVEIPGTKIDTRHNAATTAYKQAQKVRAARNAHTKKNNTKHK